MFFEEFQVGQRFTSATREVGERDLAAFTELSGDRHPLHTEGGGRFAAPVLHGPFGLAVFLGLFHELGIMTDSVLALLDTRWRYRAPILVGDTLHFELTITRCHRTSAGDEGVVNRHVKLLNQDGVTVQEGTTAVLVRARDSGPDPAGRAFGTVAWGEAVVERLGAEFAAATATWDGTIGLRSGDHEVHLRIYRGRVLEVTRRTPLGATFVLGADELTWTELITGEHNDFMRRAMRGEFEVSGSGYEYLRLTKALALLVDAAREVAR
ncbi:MaoC/PaaZ C-terminal domain-containing protein [Amycolatopsis acidicola]|nr:MaoC/PaaZ C-terminal domain-containing protein [Amycolatopsis acidicola]